MCIEYINPVNRGGRASEYNRRGSFNFETMLSVRNFLQ